MFSIEFYYANIHSSAIHSTNADSRNLAWTPSLKRSSFPPSKRSLQMFSRSQVRFATSRATARALEIMQESRLYKFTYPFEGAHKIFFTRVPSLWKNICLKYFLILFSKILPPVSSIFLFQWRERKIYPYLNNTLQNSSMKRVTKYNRKFSRWKALVYLVS